MPRISTMSCGGVGVSVGSSVMDGFLTKKLVPDLLGVIFKKGARILDKISAPHWMI